METKKKLGGKGHLNKPDKVGDGEDPQNPKLRGKAKAKAKGQKGGAADPAE